MKQEVDILFMRLALDQAMQAFDTNEIPIGALVVASDGTILGYGYNMTETNHCQSNHAEVHAIESACNLRHDWRLDGCTLYVTLEPCLMCIGLIMLSRIERLVYGARSPLFGYDLDKEIVPDLYKKHIKNITSGVLADEAQLLLRIFFKHKREKGE
jgi:tRNA(adenine34) deaminase